MTSLLLAIQQIQSPQHMMDGWGGGYGMVFMIILWIFILALIVTVIWFLIQRGSQSSTSSVSDSAPRNILKKRYASGEINEEEYRKMKEEISD